MKRAYCLLNVKTIDVEQRIIRGIATTPEPDRVGDIVESLGAQFKNPIPLLWAHKHDEPVGTVELHKPTAQGIRFTAKLPKDADLSQGPLRDRVNEAWDAVRTGIVKGVSIGFRSLDSENMRSGGVRFKRFEIHELSLVSVPANADAVIDEVKRLGSGRSAVAIHRLMADNVLADVAKAVKNDPASPAIVQTLTALGIVVRDAYSHIAELKFQLNELQRASARNN
ncbi:peptidase U35 [Diaphorobacter sp. HDW4A]|uniref:HK97 family phage prohead protease n=1 Tax=Diaphorobacter sp. HDW4A TaxID=2714924 RepID=UPI00140D6C6F|nr:HK97 family phage prohead protease [Diaphorobacter sp. HDW4A]QIL81452.1 peptidase U35 [Diaphorobacter sp. HDW4A]